MRAAVMYGAGDVRVENVPDPVLREPADAVVRVLRSGLPPAGSAVLRYATRAVSRPTASART